MISPLSLMVFPGRSSLSWKLEKGFQALGSSSGNLTFSFTARITVAFCVLFYFYFRHNNLQYS